MKMPPLTDEHGYLRRFPHHSSAKQGAWGIHAPSAKWSLVMGNRRGLSGYSRITEIRYERDQILKEAVPNEAAS